ncbi:MAG: hypothetical protein AB7R55_04345 [Gemmatimonadales bacterium]
MMVGWLLAAGALVSGGATGDTLRVDDQRCQVQGDVERVERRGRRAFRLSTGVATRRDVAFQDGTVEFDLEMSGERSFVYLRIRMASDREYEELDLRPHKGSLPDAIQYAPVYRGVSGWQLYHGAGFTAAAPMPTGGWVHVRLVVRGDRAALFLDGAAEPAMVVPRLARPSRSGQLSIRSFVPDGARGAETVLYSNIVVEPDVTPVDFGSYPVERESVPGVVARWEISEAFANPEGHVTALPEADRGPWRAVAAEPSGLVVLDRHLDRPEGARRAAVLARIYLESERSGVVRLNLGFSDAVTVFLGGRPIYSADAAYSQNFPRQDGLIGLFQFVVYVPVAPGRTEVVVAVTDVFGGWGLMGQLIESAGVLVSP